jgi:hypothetical protein
MKARPKPKPEAGRPTRERLRHARGAYRIGGDDRGVRIYRMHDQPLERLALKGKISETQFEALWRLWVHWYAAHLSGPISSIDFDKVAVSRINGGPVDDLALKNRDAFAVMWRRLEPLECVRGAGGAVRTLAASRRGYPRLSLALPWQGSCARPAAKRRGSARGTARSSGVAQRQRRHHHRRNDRDERR